MTLKGIIRRLHALAGLPDVLGEAEAFAALRPILEESLRSREMGVASRAEEEDEIIVSLTSFGPRLMTVYLTIASLMRQSRRAHRIILWLAESERDNIPASLRLLEARGLELRFCSDLLSYKKIIPALREYPRAVIITVDDDCIYDFDLIDRLMRRHAEMPRAIVANRMRRIALSPSGAILPYKKWHLSSSTDPSPLNVAIGCGGILYPPGLLPPETTDESLFMALAPRADDLWLKAMELRGDIPVVRALTPDPLGDDFIPIPGLDWQKGLAGENIRGGGNDRAMSALADYFSALSQ